MAQLEFKINIIGTSGWSWISNQEDKLYPTIRLSQNKIKETEKAFCAQDRQKFLRLGNIWTVSWIAWKSENKTRKLVISYLETRIWKKANLTIAWCYWVVYKSNGGWDWYWKIVHRDGKIIRTEQWTKR